MGVQINCVFILSVFVILLTTSEGRTTTTLSRGRVSEGRPLNITCRVVSGSIVGPLEFNRPDASGVVQCDDSFDFTKCVSSFPGYSAAGSTADSYTITVEKIDSSVDFGLWKCGDGDSGSVLGSINITLTANFSVVTNELLLITNNSQPLNASVVGVCTYEAAQCTWTYTEVSSGSKQDIPKELTNLYTDGTSCIPDDVKTTCSLQFNTVPDIFSGKLLRIGVSISHISLPDGPLVPEGSPLIYFPAVVCVCDCTVALCVVQAVWMVVEVVYLILCLTVLKDFKSRWIVLVVFGFIQIVLGLISVGCLSIEHTCSSCKSDAYVAGAVFCALSLLCGTVVVIVVLLLKVIRKPPSGTLNVASEGKKRPPPEGQAETLMIKDEKKSPQSVPPTATTTVNSSRQLPPDSGNVAGDEGKKPRPLPAPSGNVSPTVTSASQIDTDVNNETQDDVMRTPGRLPPLEMTETETEKPKKKKKKKKSKKAEDLREKREDSEEGNDDNQREEKSKESDATENQNL